MQAPREELLVWMDLEMTGLDPERDTIVEIATLITDSHLNLVANGPNLVIHQPGEVLARMNDFVRNLHTKSGLLTRIQESKISLKQAESETLAFIETHCAKNKSPLCGNSIWNDRMFLERHMPSVTQHLHYRMIDVSSIKELVRRWYPEPLRAPKKKEGHRALDDIEESIDELKWYRSNIFRPLT